MPVELLSASPGGVASHAFLDFPERPFPPMANVLSPSWRGKHEVLATGSPHAQKGLHPVSAVLA